MKNAKGYVSQAGDPTIEEGVEIALRFLRNPGPRATGGRSVERGLFVPEILDWRLCYLWDLDRRHFRLRPRCRAWRDEVVEVLVARGVVTVESEEIAGIQFRKLRINREVLPLEGRS